MLIFWEKLPKGKAVFVYEEALNKSKKSSEISPNFFLQISLSVKGKVKRNLLSQTSLLGASFIYGAPGYLYWSYL